MVTVRTYLSLMQAELAKSLLDDYEIFCVLWDEYAHSIRAPFAIPIRLVVAEGQAEAATLVLNNDLDRLAQYLEPLPESEPIRATDQSIERRAENANPWELLAIAYYFFVPAVCFLLIRYPNFLKSTWRTHYLIAKVTIAHFLGWLAITFAFSLVGTYFYMRRAFKATHIARA